MFPPDAGGEKNKTVEGGFVTLGSQQRRTPRRAFLEHGYVLEHWESSIQLD